MLFVEALESVDEFERLGDEGFGVPLVFNRVEGGRSPALSADEVSAIGYRILLLPISLLLAATQAMQETLADIRRTGTTSPDTFGTDPFRGFTDMIGLPEVLDSQARHAHD